MRPQNDRSFTVPGKAPYGKTHILMIKLVCRTILNVIQILKNDMK